MPRFQRIPIPPGAVLAEGARRFLADFWLYEGIYLLLVGPFVVADMLRVFEPLGAWGPTLLFSLISPLADAALLLAATAGKRKPGVAEAIVGALPLYVPLLLVRLLKTIGYLAGAVLGVIPGIVLAGWFCLADVLVVTKRTRDPFGVLFESRDLVRGSTWGVILTFLPVALPFQIGGLLIFAYGGIAQEDPKPWSYVANVVIDQLGYFSTILAVVIYDRIRKGMDAAPPAEGTTLH